VCQTDKRARTDSILLAKTRVVYPDARKIDFTVSTIVTKYIWEAK